MPDEPRLPTEEELRTLPRWAVVAYAARCARRVQPLFTHYWPDAPREHVEAVDRAIALAQAAAAEPVSVSARKISDAAARADADAAARADAGRTAAARVADAAADAARAALALARAARAAAAADAARAARAALARALARAARAVDARAAARRDFDLLRTLAEQHGWTDDSPVDVALLGPLWPDGLPEGWPVPDPDRSLPGFDALDALPPRAALLIGLRACRRVAEFLRGTDLADAERSHLLGVLQTIEAYCRGEPVKIAPETARDVARAFADHRTPAGAFDAAEAALHLAESNLDGAVGVTVSHALDQALSAADNAERAGRGEHLREELLASVRADFDSAKRIHLIGEATDQPWSPDRLGPLWPHGEPVSWPGEPRDDQLVTLRVRIPPLERTPANRDALREHLKNLILAASAEHIARGGSGLRIDTVRAFVPKHAGLPTGGGEP